LNQIFGGFTNIETWPNKWID